MEVLTYNSLLILPLHHEIDNFPSLNLNLANKMMFLEKYAL